MIFYWTNLCYRSGNLIPCICYRYAGIFFFIHIDDVKIYVIDMQTLYSEIYYSQDSEIYIIILYIFLTSLLSKEFYFR